MQPIGRYQYISEATKRNNTYPQKSEQVKQRGHSVCECVNLAALPYIQDLLIVMCTRDISICYKASQKLAEFNDIIHNL